MSNLLPIYVCMDETIICLLLDMLAMYMCWMKPFAMYMCWMIISIWHGYDLVSICVGMIVESIFICVYIYVKFCQIEWFQEKTEK